MSDRFSQRIFVYLQPEDNKTLLLDDKVVKKTVDDDQINTINKKDINDARHKCDETLKAVNVSCA